MADLVSSPLTDVLVVELGTRPAVHACGGLLSSLGATVVVPEDTSATGPGRAGPTHRAARMAGKRSVPGDTGLVELVAAADIVLTSSDVDQTALPPRAAGQVRCDITAFGSTGPLAGRAASDVLVQACSGTADVTGRRDAPPLITPAPLLEMESAVYAAAGAVAALLVRDDHGVGQDVEVALYDVGLNALAVFIPLPLAGRRAIRNGNRHAILSPWNTYPTEEGWVMVCAPTDQQWQRLCEVMGEPQLSTSPAFATTTARLDRADEVDEAISAWTRPRTASECLEQLAAGGIASGPIVPLEDLEDEPNLRHRRMLSRAADPVSGGSVLVPGSPLGAVWQEDRTVPVPGGDEALVAALVRDRPRREERDVALGGFPLTGVRVVEIGMNTVAPLAARQLGALGADVIKVEPPRGDVNRTNPPLREDGEAFIFAVSNTDKRGVVLDLGTPDGAEALWRLLATADVVLENLKPGSLDRLGFSAAAVRARHPELIYCSMSGFGHNSAYPGRPALDTVVQAMSGLMAATPQDGLPTKAGISVADQLGGQLGLLAVLGALRGRAHGAGGVHLDLAMHDITTWATQLLWNDAPPPSTTVLEAADGYVVVDGPVPEGPGEVADAGSPKLDRAQLVERLDSSGACAAPVLSVEEVIAHEQTRARELVVRRPTVDGDSWTVLESPLRLSRTPARVRSAMPRLGVVDLALDSEFAQLATLTAHTERSPLAAAGGRR
jgi:crotonobetainyl-CoA:carnitine CoA-transferase CaiB-like acyl-CoA transferase